MAILIWMVSKQEQVLNIIFLFQDIDDDEIDSYILSNAESEVKAKFWMKVNGEHLKEMERRL